MKRGGWRPSPLTVAVTVVVGRRHGLGIRPHQPQRGQSEPALCSRVTPRRRPVTSHPSCPPSAPPCKLWPPSVTLTNATPAAIRRPGPGRGPRPGAVILARKTGTGFVVDAVAGAGFAVGQSPGPAVVSHLEKAGGERDPGSGPLQREDDDIRIRHRGAPGPAGHGHLRAVVDQSIPGHHRHPGGAVPGSLGRRLRHPHGAAWTS